MSGSTKFCSQNHFVKICHSWKFWCQNLSSWNSWVEQLEHFTFIDAKQNATWILTKWKFTFVDDYVHFCHVCHSFDIMVSFLTCARACDSSCDVYCVCYETFMTARMTTRMTKFMISLVCVAVRSLVGNVGVIVENVGQQFWSKCAGSVIASSVRPLILSNIHHTFSWFYRLSR